jgi:hypothetical protein
MRVESRSMALNKQITSRLSATPKGFDAKARIANLPDENNSYCVPESVLNVLNELHSPKLGRLMNAYRILP